MIARCHTCSECPIDEDDAEFWRDHRGHDVAVDPGHAELLIRYGWRAQVPGPFAYLAAWQRARARAAVREDRARLADFHSETSSEIYAALGITSSRSDSP